MAMDNVASSVSFSSFLAVRWAIGDHRLRTARRRGNVPRELRDVFRRGLQKAANIAAAREMLAHGAQHHDAYACLLVESLEDEAQLIALRHFDDVERRPIEDDVGAGPFGIDLDAEAVEACEPGIGKRHRGG